MSAETQQREAVAVAQKLANAIAKRLSKAGFDDVLPRVWEFHDEIGVTFAATWKEGNAKAASGVNADPHKATKAALFGMLDMFPPEARRVGRTAFHGNPEQDD